MKSYEVISIVLSSLSVIIAGISLFYVSNIYSKINGNNNQSVIVEKSDKNKIEQKR